MHLQLQRICVDLLITTSMMLGAGCALQEGNTKGQLSAAGLIATPPSHYSTQRARYLGEKYKEKLNLLVGRIIANPKTSKLQFANNIGSSGGIGFFTHSAVKSPDERFLEVVLGTGENLEPKGEHSVKVARLFSVYGRELLLILASDLEIYNERELSGYGLNFTWRSLGSRVSIERAIVYLPKEKVGAFLKQDIGENELLADAVIFVVEQEGQAKLVSFRAQEPAPDVRAPIQEQALLPGFAKPKQDVTTVLSNGKANSAEGTKSPPDAEQSSAREKKEERAAVQSEAISAMISLPTKEEILLQQKVGPAIGEKTQSGSAIKLVPEPDRTYMPPTGITKTPQAAPLGLESPKPQFDAKEIQSRLELEAKEAKTSKLNSSVEPKKKQNDLASDPTASQLPVALEPSGSNDVPKLDLGIPKAPALGSTKMLSSSLEESKPRSEGEKQAELASIPKINPQPANREPTAPALITPSKLQDAAAEPVEQQAVLAHDKEIGNIPQSKSLVKPMPKALEGYIIQVAFTDRSEAHRWAESFQRRGYAVSMTEAGRSESLRVRIGNFRLRDDAERQLKSIQEDGLTGIILNLPHVYRPEFRSALP